MTKILIAEILFITLFCQAYKGHISSNHGPQEADSLSATIELLTHTSKMIALFHDKNPIRNATDVRLGELHNFLSYLQEWKSSAGNEGMKFFSYKLWFDLQSMILGFTAIVSVKLQKYPNSTIKPAIVNQDVVENHFCQVRACNGQNNHPTWRLQQNAQNTIRYGQTTISRKSNTGLSSIKKRVN